MKTEFSISPEVCNLAAEEAAGYYRVLLNWLNDVHEKNAEDIDSNDIKRLYRIHKKLHHRILIILVGSIENEKDLSYAQEYNQALLSEQRELLQIMLKLKPKTLLQIFRGGIAIPRYMERIGMITTDILDKWGLTEQGDRLVYSPIE